ncbi:MAG: HAMP domain-containing sensor histidine kinase [Bacillota bacterium]
MLKRKKVWGIFTQLTFLNTIIIAIVIVIAGFSVKNYACTLVNQQEITRTNLETLLNQYLVKVSILAFILAGGFHFILLKWLIHPLKKLTAATQELQKGKHPTKLKNPLIYEVKELNDAFNELSERTATVKAKQNRLLRDLSHELRTPLTNLSGYLEGLEKGVIEGDQEMYRSLQEETARIERLLEQLVRINKWTPDGQMKNFNHEEILIHELIKRRITIFHVKFLEKGIELDYNIKPFNLEGSTDGLNQVLSNILQNIVDYDNGKKVRIEGCIEKEHYLIRFSHKGRRIPIEESELIFERFYRVDASRSLVTGGTGLGLAIAKEIVQAHGGDLSLVTDSSSHTFEIRLPIPK